MRPRYQKKAKDLFKKSIDTFVIAVIFVVAAKLLEKYHFWEAIGLTPPHGIIFQGLLFLGLVVVLHHVLFDPFTAINEERNDQTFGKRKRAEEKKIHANEMLKSYEEKILAGRMEALKQKDRMAVEAENEERLRLEAAKQKSQENLDVALKQISLDVEIARSEMTKSTTILVDQLVEEILSAKLSKKTSPTKNKSPETRM